MRVSARAAIMFTVLAIQELIYIFSYRNLRRSVIRSGNFFSNKALFGAVALGFGQQLAALYVPLLSNALEVVPLHLPDWGLVLSVAFTVVLVVELVKYLTVYGRNRRK